jgi:hypothetical protein
VSGTDLNERVEEEARTMTGYEPVLHDFKHEVTVTFEPKDNAEAVRIEKAVEGLGFKIRDLIHRKSVRIGLVEHEEEDT